MSYPLENPLFVIPVTAGIIFIIAGFIMLKFPPKNINYLYGYRTKSSMKNKERWDFAQRYSASQMIKLGGLLALSSVLGFFFYPSGKTAMIVGLGLMILMVFYLLFSVEKALKEKFDK